MFGFLLINKPGGITSHDAVYAVRRALGTKRVGHAGTLDPQATGLLFMAVGPATRFLKYLDLEPKAYEFTVLFGTETDTYDADGQVVQEKPVPPDLEDRIRTSLINFLGEIEQLPPMFSAVKKDGKPLYKYARQGEEVEREPRAVNVYTLEVLSFQSPQATFRCVCSGGTYVRTIAHDLGRLVGCGAHVTALSRTAVGRFKIEQAKGLDDVGPQDLISPEQALDPMPVMRLKDGQVQVLQHGNFLRVTEAPNEELTAVTDEDGTFVCVARVLENELHPECVVQMEEANGTIR